MQRFTKAIQSAFLVLAVLALSASSATALMMEESIEGGGGGGGGGSGTTTPASNYKVVYLHGRSMKYWPSAGKLQSATGWSHVLGNYNGNARINDSTVRSTVKNYLSTNCRSPNQCVIVCYSAGCFRMLKALDELAAAGTPADKIIWIEAAASAAGGSELANKITRGLKKFIAKLFGKYEAIDEDLRTGNARNTFAYIQNRAPVSMYHSAGRKDICIKVLLFFKFCGNKSFPGRYGDGAVGIHSACGFASASAYSSCAVTASKYTNRKQSGSSYYSLNHKGIVGQTVKNGSVRLGYTSAYNSGNSDWVDPGSAYAETNDANDDADGQETATGSTECSYYASKSLAQAWAAGDTASAARGLTCVNGICIYLSGTPPPACSTYTGGGGGGGGGGPIMMK